MKYEQAIEIVKSYRAGKLNYNEALVKLQPYVDAQNMLYAKIAEKTKSGFIKATAERLINRLEEEIKMADNKNDKFTWSEGDIEILDDDELAEYEKQEKENK